MQLKIKLSHPLKLYTQIYLPKVTCECINIYFPSAWSAPGWQYQWDQVFFVMSMHKFRFVHDSPL